MRRKRPSDETLVALRTRLEQLPERSAERMALVQSCADLHGVSIDTIYRSLREQFRPRALHRRDRGVPRKLSRKKMEHLCEVIAAVKLRTTNLKRRHLSTGGVIDLLIDPGIETPDGLLRIEPDALTRSTVNRYLRAWGMDDRHIQQPPPAVRFQADNSNDCWQFDLSPSDLKQVPAPLWIEEGRGTPTLMLFSVVDDRSGAAYQEYRCVYGEDAASGLRFLFNAMAPKEEEGLVLQGIPKMTCFDNGPIAKSRVFRTVMAQLGVDIRMHMPKGSDGRRVTARAKGKVERPFRMAKEAHETLYHFQLHLRTRLRPIFGCDAILSGHNSSAAPVRTPFPERGIGWVTCLLAVSGPCAWERLCAFAREPETRKVGVDARVQADGIKHEGRSNAGGRNGHTLVGPVRSRTLWRRTSRAAFSARSVPSERRSRCTGIVASRRVPAMSESTGSRRWRRSLACCARLWRGGGAASARDGGASVNPIRRSRPLPRVASSPPA